MTNISNKIKGIKKACNITIKSLQQIKLCLKPGVSEKQIKIKLEKIMKQNKAQGFAFPTIVAFGPNTSIPHHKTGLRKLRKNDIVLIDSGAKYGGYCGDITRTFFVGKPKPQWLKVYKIVKQAQQKTINYLKTRSFKRPGLVFAKKVDKVCRDYIKSKGYGKNFTHSTGHAMGKKVHELPRISPKSKAKLKPGMIFTIEPGIYLKNKFGIRIEDMVWLSSKGLKNLTN